MLHIAFALLRSRYGDESGGTPPSAPRALRLGSGQAWAAPPLPRLFRLNEFTGTLY